MTAIKATTTGVRVIVIDGARTRLEMAERVGADDVVDFTQGDPVEQVLALVGEQEVPRLGYRGGNVDAVIDCAGAVNSSQQGLQMLKQENGRLVLVALFEHPGPLDRNMIVRKHAQLLGSWASTTAVADSPESTFGILKDLLGALEGQLTSARAGVVKLTCSERHSDGVLSCRRDSP